MSEDEIDEFLALLDEYVRREDLPVLFRRLARTHHDALVDLKAAADARREDQAKEIVRTFRHTLPLWARKPGALDSLTGIVVVDDKVTPVTVTIHWERVPRRLRSAAASLASTLVDFYDPPPKGGRPPGKSNAPHR